MDPHLEDKHKRIRLRVTVWVLLYVELELENKSYYSNIILFLHKQKVTQVEYGWVSTEVYLVVLSRKEGEMTKVIKT